MASLFTGLHGRTEELVIKPFYAAHACWLASHIALEEVGAEYSTVVSPGVV